MVELSERGCPNDQVKLKLLIVDCKNQTDVVEYNSIACRYCYIFNNNNYYELVL